MNRTEVTKVLAILKTAYPNFYNSDELSIEEIIDLWVELFKDCDYNLTMLAVKELINSSRYTPTIADIKNKMYELTHTEEPSNSELWERLLVAIRNGLYGYEKEFEKLPDIIKEFLGSPQQLNSIAEMDSETIHTVIKGQFLRQIENLKERVKQKEIMSVETKKVLFGKIDEGQKLLEEIGQSLNEI